MFGVKSGKFDVVAGSGKFMSRIKFHHKSNSKMKRWENDRLDKHISIFFLFLFLLTSGWMFSSIFFAVAVLRRDRHHNILLFLSFSVCILCLASHEKPTTVQLLARDFQLQRRPLSHFCSLLFSLFARGNKKSLWTNGVALIQWPTRLFFFPRNPLLVLRPPPYSFSSFFFFSFFLTLIFIFGFTFLYYQRRRRFVVQSASPFELEQQWRPWDFTSFAILSHLDWLEFTYSTVPWSVATKVLIESYHQGNGRTRTILFQVWTKEKQHQIIYKATAMRTIIILIE